VGTGLSPEEETAQVASVNHGKLQFCNSPSSAVDDQIANGA
jgi:hypothetical protein